MKDKDMIVIGSVCLEKKEPPEKRIIPIPQNAVDVRVPKEESRALRFDQQIHLAAWETQLKSPERRSTH